MGPFDTQLNTSVIVYITIFNYISTVKYYGIYGKTPID